MTNKLSIKVYVAHRVEIPLDALLGLYDRCAERWGYPERLSLEDIFVQAYKEKVIDLPNTDWKVGGYYAEYTLDEFIQEFGLAEAQK